MAAKMFFIVYHADQVISHVMEKTPIKANQFSSPHKFASYPLSLFFWRKYAAKLCVRSTYAP